MPTTRSASSTLTAAMMPRITFVVPRLPSIRGPSERRGLVRARVAGRAAVLAQRLVQHLPPFVGNAHRAGQGAAELRELPRHVLDGRLELPPPAAPLLRGEHVSRHCPCHAAHERRCYGLGFLRHAASSHTKPLPVTPSCMPLEHSSAELTLWGNS